MTSGETPVTSALRLLTTFGDLGHDVASQQDVGDALSAVSHTAVRLVPGAQRASVTRGTGRGFHTLGATDDVAAAADRLQYQLGSGPCVDAVTDHAVFESRDLATEERWPQWSAQAARDLGIRSVLSVRFVEQTDERLNAGLNLYSDQSGAFAGESRTLTVLLAAHAAPAVLSVLYRGHNDNLQHALESNREIGVAMGVLMATYKITRDQSFDLLRIASQNTNRKLRDVAMEVADTGVLSLPTAGTTARTGAPSRSRRAGRGDGSP